jgi:hypothetical protein
MLDCKLDCYPHTQYLESKLLLIRNSLVHCSKTTWWMSFHNLMTIYKYAILAAITYASESWSISISKELSANCSKFRDPFLIFITKAYKTVSHEALSAIARIMPIEQAMHLYKDIRAISKGNPTNAVITELNKI